MPRGFLVPWLGTMSLDHSTKKSPIFSLSSMLNVFVWIIRKFDVFLWYHLRRANFPDYEFLKYSHFGSFRKRFCNFMLFALLILSFKFLQWCYSVWNTMKDVASCNWYAWDVFAKKICSWNSMGELRDYSASDSKEH